MTGLEKIDLNSNSCTCCLGRMKTKSPEAAALIEIHKAYMKANGIM